MPDINKGSRDNNDNRANQSNQPNQYKQLIMDAHAHIYPASIAAKATEAIGEFYEIQMSHTGSSQELIDSGSAIGVCRYLVCSAATTPGQVASINRFIAQECARYPSFYGFGTLHPDLEDARGEVDRLLELGLHGVKLHPDFQKFAIDDPAAIALYRICAKEGLPVLFHTGDARFDYSSPLRLARALEEVADLVAIGAHFGGYSEWEQAYETYPVSERLFFDTSSSLFMLGRQEARAFISRFGASQFFFGVDFPMWDHAEELARFDGLDLDPKTRAMILSQNFTRVFGAEKAAE